MPVTELVLRELRKRFGATEALGGVSLRLSGAQVLALVGENGAGKSTLIKILCGIHRPDSGQIEIDGNPVRFASPAAALRAGLVLVPQELRIVPLMTVAENILLGHLPVRRLGGVLPVVDHEAIRDRAQAVLNESGITLDVGARAGDLTFAQRQLVVIARALGHRARILILDEPTASLERREVDHLFSVVGRLRDQGMMVIYISHRLDEVQRLADACLVLRDGQVAARIDAPPFETAALTQAMTGGVLESRQREARTPGEARLKVAIDGGAIECRRNEIAGLGGLLGSGAAALLLRIYQGSAATGSHRAVRASIAAATGFVPAERAISLVMSMSVRDNIVLPHLDSFARALSRDERRIDAVVEQLIELLAIRPRDSHAPVRNLSGGNQQKVAFAKWLVGRLELLLLDEPTAGIDIAAKAAIHRRIESFAAAGGAVLLSTSDAAELLDLSDTVTVLRQGRAVGRMERGASFGATRLRELLESHP